MPIEQLRSGIIRSFSHFGAKLWNEIPCHIRHLTKNKSKKTLRKLLFDILDSEDDYIDTPNLIKKFNQPNISKNKFLLISFYFTIYLFNSVFLQSVVCYLVLIHITIFVSFTVNFPQLIALVFIFIFFTHCPASNSLASCGQYFRNFIFFINKVLCFCCCCCYKTA